MTHAWIVMGLVGCGLAEVPETSTGHGESNPPPTCEDEPFGCANSAGFLSRGMHELSLLGVPNSQGYRLQSGRQCNVSPAACRRPAVSWGGRDYIFDVSGGELRGLDADGTAGFSCAKAVASGDGKCSAVLHVVTEAGAPVYDMIIVGYRELPYQVGTGTLHLYTVHRRLAGSTDVAPLCNPLRWQPQTELNPPEYFDPMAENELLMFTGDRFYPQTLRLASTDAEAEGWVTFGCAGQALAKLDLSGNTRWRQPTNDWASRQATLKLYTADYCDDGTAHTRSGTPLVWRGPMTSYVGAPEGIEARWNAHGASCLGTPRLAAQGIDPSVRAAVMQACGDRLHDCVITNVNNLNGQPRISANYLVP